MRLLKTIQAVVILGALAHAAVPLSGFDTVLGIQADGSVVVVERLVPVTPERNMVWSTGTEYPGIWGIHEPRIVDVFEVTTADGVPLHYELRRLLGRLEVRIDTTNRTGIRLVYAVRNGVRFLGDHDELHWNAGDGWRGNTQAATLFVQVPPQLAHAARTQAYVHGERWLPLHATAAAPDRVWFEVKEPLKEHEQLFAEVVMPKGELKEPAMGKRLAWFVRANTIILLPLLTLAVMLLLRAGERLPPHRRYTMTPRYEPPKGLTPAEVGLLIDDRLDPRDVAATFVDLAVRGYIRLEPSKPDEGVAFAGHDFKLISLRTKQDWRLLPLHERTLLLHTFYGGEWTKLSSLTKRFYAIVPLMRRQVAQLLRTKGMYWTDPEYAQSARLTLLLLFFAAALVIQLLGLYSFASSWLLSILSVGISAAIVYGFGRRITSKTLAGMRTFEQILGFEHFLNLVESDRLERLPAELFEKWLPFAIALGVEHRWARNFEGVAIGGVEWISELENKMFDTSGLVSALAAIARESARSGSFASD